VNQRSLDEFIETRYLPKDQSVKLPNIPGITAKIANEKIVDE